MKQCTRCKAVLPFEKFNRDSAKRDGHKSHCRQCARDSALAAIERKTEEKLNEDESVEIAKRLLREGRCTENTMRKYGVPQGKVSWAMRKAEAAWVNGAMQLFPPPLETFYDEDHNNQGVQQCH